MRSFMQHAIAYAFATASAFLAATYGLLSAAGVYGYVKALILCLVAFGGCHGPAYISKLRRAYGLAAALLGGLATLVCLLVTLWGGLGTISSGGAEMRAGRAKVAQDVARDRDTMARLQREREALASPRPAAAIAPEIAAAKAAPAYRNTNGCDPAEITTGSSRAHCAAFRRLESELATATEAARLEAEISAIDERLRQAGPETEIDPQAAATSRLTGLTVELSAALYALAASVALELMGMVAMMVAWAERHRPAIVRDAGLRPIETPANGLAATPAPLPSRKQPAHTPARKDAQVIEMRPQVFGSVKKFMAACLSSAQNERVQVRALYERYKEWCAAGGTPAADIGKFLDEVDAISARNGIRIELIDGQVYALDVRLSA